MLVDEAYHHYVESNDYESVIPLVAQYPNLIVARTFSKIYSMAGLRCGYCVARPELIQRMRAQQSLGQREHHGDGRGNREPAGYRTS